METYGEPSVVLEVKATSVTVNSLFLKKCHCQKSHKKLIASVVKR